MVAIQAPQLDPYEWVGPGDEPGPSPRDRHERRARAARRARLRRREALLRRRRLTALVAAGTLVLLVVAGVGTLVGGSSDGVEARPLATISAGELTADGAYVVQPGDTLWTIARRLAADGDPRPLVDELRRRQGDVELQVGDRIDLSDLG